MFRTSVLCILFVAVILVLQRETVAQGSRECPVNSRYAYCAHICEPSCGAPHPNIKICSLIECVAAEFGGCRCIEGYVRDWSTNQCVLPSQCPPSS